VYDRVRRPSLTECPSRVIIIIINNITHRHNNIIIVQCNNGTHGAYRYIIVYTYCTWKPSATQYRWKETHSSSDCNILVRILYTYDDVVRKLINRSRVLNELSFLSAGLNPLSVHTHLYYTAHWVGNILYLATIMSRRS